MNCIMLFSVNSIIVYMFLFPKIIEKKLNVH